jgi:hypothetical protein
VGEAIGGWHCGNQAKPSARRIAKLFGLRNHKRTHPIRVILDATSTADLKTPAKHDRNYERSGGIWKNLFGGNRRRIAKKIAKNKRCYANTLRPRSRMLLKGDEGGVQNLEGVALRVTGTVPLPLGDPSTQRSMNRVVAQQELERQNFRVRDRRTAGPTKRNFTMMPTSTPIQNCRISCSDVAWIQPFACTARARSGAQTTLHGWGERTRTQISGREPCI